MLDFSKRRPPLPARSSGLIERRETAAMPLTGDDTRTRVRLIALSRVIRLAPQGSHGPGELSCPQGKTAQREGNGAERFPARRTLSERANRLQPANPDGALRAIPRHDHPDAPTRRRGHPWPLVCARAVPINPAAEDSRRPTTPTAKAHATSTRRSGRQTPCSEPNPGPESPTIIHGAPKLADEPALQLAPGARRVGRWRRLGCRQCVRPAGTAAAIALTSWAVHSRRLQRRQGGRKVKAANRGHCLRIRAILHAVAPPCLRRPAGPPLGANACLEPTRGFPRPACGDSLAARCGSLVWSRSSRDGARNEVSGIGCAHDSTRTIDAIDAALEQLSPLMVFAGRGPGWRRSGEIPAAGVLRRSKAG